MPTTNTILPIAVLVLFLPFIKSDCANDHSADGDCPLSLLQNTLLVNEIQEQNLSLDSATIQHQNVSDATSEGSSVDTQITTDTVPVVKHTIQHRDHVPRLQPVPANTANQPHPVFTCCFFLVLIFIAIMLCLGHSAWVLKSFLVLGLITTIMLGLSFPQPGAYLFATYTPAGFTLDEWAVIALFILCGLCLSSISECLQYKELVIGTTLIMFVTPLIAIPITYIGIWFPSLNKLLLQGMCLFVVVPTTLSSGITMVTQANGNVPLAVLLTTVTNLAAVFTLPWSTSQIFAVTVQINPFSMLNELIALTLVPLIFGMTLRLSSTTVDQFAKRNVKVLGITQNCCILSVVWLMVSTAAPMLFASTPVDIALCLFLAGFVHGTFRVVGYVVATGFDLPPREWVTIVLMCSQKSLPVCVSVMSSLPKELQQTTGLLILPCIFAHAAQLIIDSILAVRWQQPERTEAAPEKLQDVNNVDAEYNVAQRRLSGFKWT